MADTNQKVTRAIVVVPASSLDGVNNQKVERFALFDASGDPVPFEGLIVQDGGDVILTGYTSGSIQVIAATDTVNEAFGSVQAVLDDLETRVALNDAKVSA